ncbi:MAG: carbon storage regulator [Planctomicrobium sp.]|jgi:carbon storage regulator|nr:carbon storage regulator [Planctomicrobium sp.]
MLVITRKTNEEIIIGDNIVLKVISNGNGRVKIGIEAPQSVRIARGEIAFREELIAEAAEQEYATA